MAAKRSDIERKGRFGREYANDPSRNGARIARLVGYAPKTAAQQACRLLKDPFVQQTIAEQEAIIANRLKTLDVDTLVGQLLYTINFDIADCFDTDGNMLPITQMPAAARKAIERVELFETKVEQPYVDEKITTTTKKIFPRDQLRAIELAAKLKGFLKDQVKMQHGVDDVLGDILRLADGTSRGLPDKAEIAGGEAA